jgi:hypothetical protein
MLIEEKIRAKNCLRILPQTLPAADRFIFGSEAILKVLLL